MSAMGQKETDAIKDILKFVSFGSKETAGGVKPVPISIKNRMLTAMMIMTKLMMKKRMMLIMKSRKQF